jgi:hypothetical protein
MDLMHAMCVVGDLLAAGVMKPATHQGVELQPTYKKEEQIHPA